VFRLRRPRSPVHALRRGAAVVIAAVAVVLALRPAAPESGARAAPSTVPVVVAAADLPPGATLTARSLRVARFPAELVPEGTAASVAQLTGRRLAAGVRAGEPVSDVRMLGAGLTAQLSAGQVAAPVRLADLAVSRLVRAGDRVDVLASTPDAARAEVVASGALVLATSPGARPDPAADGDGGLLLLAVDGSTATRLAAASASATLSVTLSPP